MDIPIETYQTFLDNAAIAAQIIGASTANAAASGNLLNQLMANDQAAIQLYKGGTVASFSKNSLTQSYRGSGLGTQTTQQMARVWRELINFCKETSKYIARLLSIVPQPNPLPSWWPPDSTDLTLYNFMVKRLCPEPEYQSDFTGLRFYPLAPFLPITW